MVEEEVYATNADLRASSGRSFRLTLAAKAELAALIKEELANIKFPSWSTPLSGVSGAAHERSVEAQP